MQLSLAHVHSYFSINSKHKYTVTINAIERIAPLNPAYVDYFQLGSDKNSIANKTDYLTNLATEYEQSGTNMTTSRDDWVAKLPYKR